MRQTQGKIKFTHLKNIALAEYAHDIVWTVKLGEPEGNNKTVFITQNLLFEKANNERYCRQTLRVNITNKIGYDVIISERKIIKIGKVLGCCSSKR